MFLMTGSDGKIHRVPEDRAEDFFHGDTGAPLTNEEYDEHKRRRAELEALGDVVTWEVLP